MPQRDLTETLQGLVRRHGISSVLHSLADIQAVLDQHSSSARKRTYNSGSKSSAVDYVNKMTLPQEKAEVMMGAAQRFEDGGFLPSIADIREFCRIHNVELGRSASRASSVPRVFTFLAAMDTAKITKLLDEGAFSGPARLAPLADAIRNRSAVRGRSHRAGFVQAVSDTPVADRLSNGGKNMGSRRAILIREKGHRTCIVIDGDDRNSQWRRLVESLDGIHEIDGRKWSEDNLWQKDAAGETGKKLSFDDLVAVFMDEKRWPGGSSGPIRNISDASNNLPCPWDDDIKA